MSNTYQESRMVKLYNAEGLAPFMVKLESVEEGEYLFCCLAEDSDHAREQAENSYPEDKVVSVELQEYVIYSPNEAAISDGAGFWSNEDGWVNFDSATLFTESDRSTLELPLATGQDARWVHAAEAEESCG